MIRRPRFDEFFLRGARGWRGGEQSSGVQFLLAEVVVVGISLAGISFEWIEFKILKKLNFMNSSKANLQIFRSKFVPSN